MSAITLENELYADIKLDNKDIPGSAPNFLEELSIIENVAAVPVMSMIVNDTADLFSTTSPLTDGNKFSITIGTSMTEVSENKSLDFRLFNWQGTQYQNGFKYELNAILDNHKFITDIKNAAYIGTSSSVLEQIAANCGMDYENSEICSDSQTWLNFCETQSIFTRKIVQHSYIPNGCMASAVTATNSLIYKDIVKAINGEAIAEFNNMSAIPNSDFESVHLMREYRPSSSAGFMNAWLNYGYVVVEDTLEGLNKTYTSTVLTSTSGGSAAVNTDVSSDQTASRKDYVVQDCGNTHKDYWRGYHNNIRILSLFSQKLVCMVDRVTNLSPLDVIQVKLLNAETGKSTGYTGKYIIGAKKTVIKGTRYAEFFELYRNTVPQEGSASLANTK
jgi:hypothetical protein